MARRKKSDPADEPPRHAALPPGTPVRLLAYDWPFPYSVLPNGNLVINKRLPSPPKPQRTRAQLHEDLGDALM